MPELFVELLSEEIPARMQRRAADDLKRLVTNALVDAGLTYEGAWASATPRRLALSVQGLPARSADRREERRGPRVGAPEAAIAGFLRSAGLARIEDAVVEADKKGEVYVARTLVPGRPAIAIAGEAIAAAVRRFPWPKAMRWGAASADPGSLRWVRPLVGVVATFGADNEDPDIVPVDLPVPVGETTRGHRFHAPEAIRVRRLADYRASLERANVVVDIDRRRDIILYDAREKVFALGLELVEDDALLEEVAGLVEWPVVLVGRFAEGALELPEEVIRLTIRANQKCFVTRDPATGRLANAFVLTANVAAADGGAAIVAGNERVVRARLADARFFYEQDRRVPLAEHGKKLAGVTFHEKLGSQAERVERIAALAREIAPKVGADPDLAERAARLAKADLGTLMISEFPELQGYMGRRYAMAAGEPAEVAAAIEEHYAPQGPGDAVPTAPLSVAVALADKLDSLVALWAAGEKPTGSGDAFGLRRAALGIIRLALVSSIRIDLKKDVRSFYRNYIKDNKIYYNRLLIREASGVFREPEDWYKSAYTISDGDGMPVGWGIDRELLRFSDTDAFYIYDQLREGLEDRPQVMFLSGTNETNAWIANQAQFVLPSLKDLSQQVAAFVLDRLVVQQRDAGVASDLVQAVAEVSASVDPVDIVNRLTALRAFLATDDGANLMAGFRRATNILRAEEKKDGASVEGAVEHNVLVEPEELTLAGAVEVAEVRVRDAVAAENYAGAMAELAKLRAPVDAFFDKVLVNADDPRLRLNRLRILAELRNVTRDVADFSAISGG